MKNHSMLSEIWRRFKKNKQALVGLIVLILFVLIAIFADQIAPFRSHHTDMMIRMPAVP